MQITSDSLSPIHLLVMENVLNVPKNPLFAERSCDTIQFFSWHLYIWARTQKTYKNTWAKRLISLQIHIFAFHMKKLWFLGYMWNKLWSQLMRLWYHISDQRRLRMRSLARAFAVHTHKYGSRWRVRPTVRHLALLDGCACAFEEFTEDEKYHNLLKWLVED